MILHRFYDDLLAQASYLVACDTTHQALVIDPTLDLAPYIDAASAQGLTIVCVTETHIHADFVSGARALAAATGARLALSAEGGPGWEYVLSDADAKHIMPLHDGDEIDIGTIRVRAMHTPGHTPEHLAFIVTDTGTSDQPLGMFSGDFIFVGDVGRPDLLERAAHVAGTMEPAARQLYASLQRATALPDYLQLWPGHGAGSACGKALGSMPQSTMGYERIANPALRHVDEAAFVADILSAQPEPPRYFARMKRVNRDGMPDVRSPARTHLSVAAVHAAVAEGVLVVDTRPSAQFMRAFVRGSVCVPRSNSFLTYFGAIAPEECPVVLLVADESHVAQLAMWLHVIGFDDVRGWALAGDVLKADGPDGSDHLSLNSVPLDDARDRLAQSNPPLLIDVRTAGERLHGKIPGATEVALNALDDWSRAHTPSGPIILHCQSGTRAIIGASVLRARGFSDVHPMAGGYEAWVSAGLPVRS